MTLYLIIKAPNDILFDYWIALYYCLIRNYTDIKIITTIPLPDLPIPKLNFPSCEEILEFIQKYTKHDIVIFVDYKYIKEYFLDLPKENIYIYFNRDPYNKILDFHTEFLKNNFQIIEYYESNRNFLYNFIDKMYHSKVYIIPQLFNKRDTLYQLPFNHHPFYDVGMIFRYRERDIRNRRETFWNQITDMSKLLITGFGLDRDLKIQNCKIIINIRSKTTDDDNIVENRESLRIDRIISKKILVVSEAYKHQTRYNDGFIIQVPLDKILTTCQGILDNFHDFRQEHFKHYRVEEYEKESQQLIQPILDNIQ